MKLQASSAVFTAPRLFCWLLGLLCLLASTGAAQGGRRVALVIGNAGYSVGPLSNPINDARLVEATLKPLGFSVERVENASLRRLQRAVREFGSRAQGAEVALIYYAGHALQQNGENYLVPIDAEIDKAADVAGETVAASTLLLQLEGSGAQVGLVILDACRNNPFSSRTRSASRGLVRMDAPSGTIVAYAAQPGAVADDGSAGNGLYTRHLTHYLRQPGLDIRDVFDQTAISVERDSGGRQRPREDVGLRGSFYLAGRSAAAAAPPLVAAPVVSELVAPAPLRLAEPVRAPRPVAGQVVKDCDVCPELVAIPGGSFMMGSPTDEPSAVQRCAPTLESRPALPRTEASFLGRDKHDEPRSSKDQSESRQSVEQPCEPDRIRNERPQHRVTVSGFLLGKTEVTQDQWKAVMSSNPSHFSACGDDCPVENVRWNEGQEYVKRLSARTGKQYRLPSEAEWEYAARAGTTTSSRTNVSIYDNPWDGHYLFDKGVSYKADPRKVGSLPANAFGLHNMLDNVWEWVQDVWHDNYRGAPSDGSAWTLGGHQAQRVYRGNYWLIPSTLGLTSRDRLMPEDHSNYSGLRIARTF